MRRMCAFLLLASLGCRQRDLTLSVDAVTRDYGLRYEKCAVAAEDALKSSELRIVRKQVEEGMTEIEGSDRDGRITTVHVTRFDSDRSRVLVRVEPGDVDAANRFHERLADEIGLGRAREGILGIGGGEAITTEYPQNIQACYRDALRTCKVLDLLVTHQSLTFDDRGRVDARTSDSTPVAFVLKGRADGGTRVTFVAGARGSVEMLRLVRRMKEEFDGGARP